MDDTPVYHLHRQAVLQSTGRAGATPVLHAFHLVPILLLCS